MAPKNKKGQKVLLTDFLADTSTGRSWADEMDELPTAPAPRDPNEPPNSGLGGSHLSRGDGNRYADRDYNRRGDREGMDRPSRVEIPMPDRPPFNAFVGNLSWEVGATELEEFFGAANIISIRLITDSETGKPKGYGYVEFDVREALVAATDKSGRELGGRPVRVSVAEPPKEREDRTGGSTWRREGPLPSFDDNRRTRHSSHQEYSGVDDADRGERMGFGSKFVPSSDTATNLTGRTQSGRGYSRAEGGFGTESEGANRGERMGFGSRFVASADEPRRDREPPLRGSNYVPSRGAPVGSEDGHSASGGSIRRAPLMERKPTELEPTEADTVSNWRKAKPVSEHEPSSTAPPIAPPTRRKLELSARTVTSSDGASTPPTSLVSTKPSPFGAAKPIDTTEREKAIQERLNRERTESASAIVKKTPASADDKSTADTDPKGPSAVAAPAAPKAPKPNPFGAAKPVDTLSKEIEVEQRLEREKALLDEKLKKEAQEGRAVPSSPAKQPIRGPSNAGTPESSAPTSSATQSPTAPASQPRSRWTTQPPPVSKPTNGNVAPLATTTATAPAPKSATSPLSPSLSSFRKEGISFAALAKTAAANSSSGPATTPAPKSSAKDEQPPKAVAQHPRTILKRVEGLEIKNE